MGSFEPSRRHEYTFVSTTDTDQTQTEDVSLERGVQPHSANPPVLRSRVQSVLVVLERSDADLTSLVCGLRSQVILVCVGSQQATQLVGDFAPDVVLVDLRLADALTFAGRLAANSDATLVALHSPETIATELCDRPFPFHFRLQRPVMPAELEQFLWQIAERPVRRLDVVGRQSHG